VRNRVVVFAVLLVGLGLVASPLAGHHAFTAQYDEDQPIEFTGIVAKVEWMNPHAYFYVNVEDQATGEVVYWAAEMGSPTSLMRRGWTRNSMKIGDVVTVEGSRAKDGSALMNARSIVLTDSGQRLFAGSSQNQGQQ
jgi:hypothetical protein